MPESNDPMTLARHDVTAILVTHDGRRWLPRVLTALSGQRRGYQRLVAVDTGSIDDTAAVLAQHLPAAAILNVAREAGFGDAVAHALDTLDAAAADAPTRADPNPADPNSAGPPEAAGLGPEDPVSQRPTVRWLWLLHDDCEPDPEALAQLLAAVDNDDRVAVVGPKVRGWYRRGTLLELGVSIDGGGARETSLERGEEDQGQHDARREVLAVGSAGMLVRRDVFDELGGFDPALPLMRDDVDLCWRVWLAGHRVAVAPAAVVHHAEAASTGRRDISVGTSAQARRPHRIDRAAAMRVLLANRPTAAFVATVPRLILGTVLRALGYLLAKVPARGVDELLALASVAARPRAILRTRRRRRDQHAVSPGSLRRLFPRPGHQVLVAVDALSRTVSGPRSAAEDPAGRHRAPEAGPSAAQADNLDPGPSAPQADDPGAGGALARRVLRSPGWLLAITLTVVTAVACRDLLVGGRLSGGALLAVPGGAGELWSAYTSAWHPTGVGSTSAAAPYLAVVAVLATVLAGSADLAVSVLLLGSVPLAGMCAYLAARPLVASRVLRAWAAASYALVPVLTGAVATGRLGTAVTVALLPAAALAGVRTLGTARVPGSSRAAWTAALLLAVMIAFVPLSWPLAVLLLAGAVGTGAGSRDPRWWTRIGVVLVVPLVVLLPWSTRLATDPSTFLTEAGLPAAAEADRSAAALLALSPGGPGANAAWIGALPVLAGLAGLGLGARRRVVLAGWSVAGVGFVAALTMSRLTVPGPQQAPAWPGLATAVAAAGVLVAAAVGAEGIGGRLGARAFGLAQPVTVLVAALAALAPVLAAGTWVARGADAPLQRGDPVTVPAFVAADNNTTDRPRALVLRPDGPGRLSYALVRGDGPRLGDGDLDLPRPAVTRLDEVVADLASGRDEQVSSRLAGFAVGHVVVDRSRPQRRSRPEGRPPAAGRAGDALVQRLDVLPGLRRISASGSGALWQVTQDVARVRILDQAGSGAPATTVPSGPVDARAPLSAGGASAPVLVLADAADPGWWAEVDGRRLEAGINDGWAQAFALPRQGGVLRLGYSDPTRPLWLFSQATLLVVMVVLTLPGAASRPVDPEDPADSATEPMPSGRHAHDSPNRDDESAALAGSRGIP